MNEMLIAEDAHMINILSCKCVILSLLVLWGWQMDVPFEDNGVSIGRKKCSLWPAGTDITKI